MLAPRVQTIPLHPTRGVVRILPLRGQVEWDTDPGTREVQRIHTYADTGPNEVQSITTTADDVDEVQRLEVAANETMEVQVRVVRVVRVARVVRVVRAQVSRLSEYTASPCYL